MEPLAEAIPDLKSEIRLIVLLGGARQDTFDRVPNSRGTLAQQNQQMPQD